MDYYTSQHGTGAYSKFNCGLACVAMATRFAKGKIIDIEQTRKNLRSRPTLSTKIIQDQLNANNIKSSFIAPSAFDDFTNLINQPDTILIANPNMANVARGKKINRAYSTWHPFWGHYIVVDSLTDQSGLWCAVADPYHNANPRVYNTKVLYDGMISYNPNVFIIRKG